MIVTSMKRKGRFRKGIFRQRAWRLVQLLKTLRILIIPSKFSKVFSADDKTKRKPSSPYYFTKQFYHEPSGSVRIFSNEKMLVKM